jgi:hypothetical protein
MKPVNLSESDNDEEMRQKLILLIDDIYGRFHQLQDKVINFDTGKSLMKTSVAAAVNDLDQTISNPPTQTEVQDLSDKVDELLTSLRNANVLSI